MSIMIELSTITFTFLLLTASTQAVIQENLITDPSDLKALGQESVPTVSSNGFSLKTPEWVKNAIFYQIFPDRFRDGDPDNNPIGDGGSGDVLWKSWSRGSTLYAEKMKWTDLPEEPAMGRDWFGGDLKGIEDEAQYLADLGVTAIYFNPIMDSTDNHGYTVIDYKSVNRYFGANKRAGDGTLILDPEASLQVFRNMTTALDTYGIRVILDGVFNHVSAKNQWFDRDNDFSTLGAYENQTSPWYNWFNFSSWPNQYTHWDGAWNMPEANEVDGFRNYIFEDPNDSVVEFWNDLGVDGWRLDTGQDVSHEFWNGFRTAYKQLNPDGYIVGEYFGDASPWLNGTEWDSVMNYPFRAAVLDWVSGVNPSDLDFRLTSIQRDYPSQAFYTAFNLLGSHDTERALTHLVGNENRMKLAVIFQMTYPGAPVIYYGDEVGMQGLSDPDCRRPYLWQDQGLSPDSDMLAHYKKLISIRKTYSVLRTGSLSTLTVDDANHVYALVRQDNSTNPTAVLVYNNGNSTETVTLDLTNVVSENTELTDVLNSKKYKVQNGKITLQIDPLWADILLSGEASLPQGPSTPPFLIYAIGLGVAAVAVVGAYLVLRRRRMGKSEAKQQIIR